MYLSGNAYGETKDGQLNHLPAFAMKKRLDIIWKGYKTEILPDAGKTGNFSFKKNCRSAASGIQRVTA